MQNRRIAGWTAGLVVYALTGLALVSDGVERFPDGTVSVHVVDAPLGALLRQVAHRALIDPEVESRKVSLVLVRRPAIEVLHAIVTAADVGYILYGDAVYAGTESMLQAARERSAEPAESSDDADSPSRSAARKAQLSKEAAKPDPPRSTVPDGHDAKDDALEAAAREDAAESQRQFEQLTAKMAPLELGGQAERTVFIPVPQLDGSLTETSGVHGAGGVIPLPFAGPNGDLRTVKIDPRVRPLNPLEAITLVPVPANVPPPTPPRIDPDAKHQ